MNNKFSLKFYKYKNNLLKIFLLMCLNVFIFLIFYVCAIQIIYAETKADINKNSQLVELNAELNKLSPSSTTANNGNSAIKQKDNIEKTNSLKNDNSKNPAENKESAKPANKAINEDVKNKTKDTPKENPSSAKPDKKAEEAYTAEKKKAEWIIYTIESGIHKDRKSAINQILTIKDPGIKQNLGDKLIEVIKNEAELEVKVKSITVIGEIRQKNALPALIALLNNEPDDVTVAAVYAIKRIGDTSAKPDLIAKLKEQKLDNSTNLTEALIDTLGEFKATELMTFASEAIKSPKTHQSLRELFVLFLGKTGSKDSKNTLLDLLKDEDENEQIRAFAANSLANLIITEAIPEIEKVVQTIDSYPFSKKKKYNNLYIYCVSSLVKLGYEKSLPMFLNMLRSDNAVVRLKAVTLIKDTKEKRTIDILKYKMLYDPSPKVQSVAKEALKDLGIDVEAIKKDKLNTEQNKKFISDTVGEGTETKESSNNE